ncbi:hypothetical protein V8G54_018909 [Vigna mungo]|uniref:Uncharacterized protein n=1 Tax=Vigna mungo TaxID=3915 RepID=A0AAQ3NBN2_VIGMU
MRWRKIGTKLTNGTILKGNLCQGGYNLRGIKTAGIPKPHGVDEFRGDRGGSDVKQSASIFRRNIKHIRNWLEEESAASSRTKVVGCEIFCDEVLRGKFSPATVEQAMFSGLRRWKLTWGWGAGRSGGEAVAAGKQVERTLTFLNFVLQLGKLGHMIQRGKAEPRGRFPIDRNHWGSWGYKGERVVVGRVAEPSKGKVTIRISYNQRCVSEEREHGTDGNWEHSFVLCNNAAADFRC